MPLNDSFTFVVSGEQPSNFEDEVTFTATVSDPVTGDPNPNTAPTGAVFFVADGSFGFGSGSLSPLTASVTAIQSSTSVATYIAANSFAPGQRVTTSGFFNTLSVPNGVQFNQTNVAIASATSTSFTVNGVYTAQIQVSQAGNSISTTTSTAQGSTTILIPGLHTIQALYTGPGNSGNHNPSNSNILTQQVINVPATTIVEVPGFALIASFSLNGDNTLPPSAQLFPVPSTATIHQTISLLWSTLNVAFIRITGNNGIDYQPSGFDTGFISTSGSGLYVVAAGFTQNISLTLQGYNFAHVAIPGVSSSANITIT
jgi:hypothetical protein